jgi:hypothetical protein
MPSSKSIKGEETILKIGRMFEIIRSGFALVLALFFFVCGVYALETADRNPDPDSMRNAGYVLIGFSLLVAIASIVMLKLCTMPGGKKICGMFGIFDFFRG